MSDEKLLASAIKTLELEKSGISSIVTALADELGVEFIKAVEHIERAEKNGGRVTVSGMGKSGHIGRKIAATLASTGTPSPRKSSTNPSNRRRASGPGAARLKLGRRLLGRGFCHCCHCLGYKCMIMLIISMEEVEECRTKSNLWEVVCFYWPQGNKNSNEIRML